MCLSSCQYQATGKYGSAVDKARECAETASRGEQGSLGREHALRMSHHAIGVALLRLGKIDEAIRSLDKAREIAVKGKCKKIGVGC